MAPSLHPAEVAEIEAVRDLFAACPPQLARRAGVRAEAIGGGLAFGVAAHARLRELNRVIGVSTVEELDAAERFFRELGVGFYLSLMPDTALEPELEQRGYTHDYAWMKFARRPGEPPVAQTVFQVEAVGREHGEDFGRTLAAGYGLPVDLAPWFSAVPGRDGWLCLVAYDGREPVATGALFVHEDVGWLGSAATLAAARGRGAQSAILAERVAQAPGLGCRTLITETGERVEHRPSGSYRNIVRAGFEEVYVRPNLRSPSQPGEPSSDESGRLGRR